MKHLEAMVESGDVAISQQVAREAKEARHVDLPEAWVLGVFDQGPHRVITDPSNPNYLKVMHTVGQLIVDPAAESDPADPWVLSLALDMQDDGNDAVVVTRDQGLIDACEQIGVDVASLSELFAAAWHAGPQDTQP